VMPRSSALFTECPTRRTFKGGVFNRPHIQMRQLRCKRFSLPASCGRSGHGLWHVAGAAPLRCAARTTGAPTYLFKPPTASVLDSNASFGIISPTFSLLGLLRCSPLPTLCAGAPIFSTLLPVFDKMSLSIQNATLLRVLSR